MADIKRLPGPRVDFYDWQLAAACRGMDSAIFFHPLAERLAAREARIAQAKAVCRTCPAIKECLDHALKVQEPYGIWGGHSEDERASLLGVESLRYPARVKDNTPQTAAEPGWIELVDQDGSAPSPGRSQLRMLKSTHAD